MRFPDWVRTQPTGTLSRLMRETGLGWTTLQRLMRGEVLVEYLKAKLLSEAIGGAVTIADLCEPVTAKKRRGSRLRAHPSSVRPARAARQ